MLWLPIGVLWAVAFEQGSIVLASIAFVLTVGRYLWGRGRDRYRIMLALERTHGMHLAELRRITGVNPVRLVFMVGTLLEENVIQAERPYEDPQTIYPWWWSRRDELCLTSIGGTLARNHWRRRAGALCARPLRTFLNSMWCRRHPWVATMLLNPR